MRETMGVRERLNRNPRLAAIVMAVLLLVAGVAVALQFSDGAHAAGMASDKAFFTIDDGATWFADDAAKIAPFQHDGKEAVRAYVFECNGKRFVNHLERFTPEGHKAAEAAIKANQSRQPADVAAQVRLSGAEVKRPGAKLWASLGDLTKSGPILRPRCPGGGGDAKPVEP
jgi:hypothetical protein